MILLGNLLIFAQTTEFTYQRKLTNTVTVSPTYDFEFRLFDAETGGAALVVLTRTVRTVRTLAFGFYHFEEVSGGETYIFVVQSKQFHLSPRIVNVIDELNELDFIAEP